MPKHHNKSSFEELLKSLYQIKDKKINELQGKERNWFDSLTNFVKILYGTPYFERLHEKIEEIFGNINEIKPGTVSGYILGAILSKKFQKKYSKSKDEETWTCSPFALQSLPTVNQRECMYYVITIDIDPKNKNKYLMTLNKSSDEDRAIIFTTTVFTGLTNEDKMKLKNYGINHVKVFKIGPREFFDIISEWTPIERVPDFNPSALDTREFRTPGPIDHLDITRDPFSLVMDEGITGPTGPTGISTLTIILIITGSVLFVIFAVFVIIMLISGRNGYTRTKRRNI